MSTNLSLRSESTGLRSKLIRRRVMQAASLVFAACCFLSSEPARAQDLADTIAQLSMLDTPTDDLIRLSSEYTTALRDLKVARLSIDTVQTLRPNAVITNLEVQIANLNLEAAERRLAILRAIVEKQLAAAENKLEIVGYLESLGSPLGDQQGQDAGNFMRENDEATVKILKMILAMK